MSYPRITNSRVLVTGGAGFIGSNVVRKFVSEGYQVTVYDNLTTGYLENIRDIEGVVFIHGDILDRDKLVHAAKEHDVLLHLAAHIGNVKSVRDPWFDSNVNIIGTLNVLDACRQAGIRKIVYSSSAAIFGELKYQPIDELHPVEPDSPYGVSKLAAEKHILSFGRLYDIDTVALRYFNVYGINQRYDEYGNVIPIWARLLLKNEPITIYDDGEQTRDFINVEDVAMINYLAAVTPEINGVYNLGTGNVITINHLANMMMNIFGVQVERRYAPKRIGEVRHCKADISKATSSFKFNQYIPFEEGLKKYCTWLQKIM